MQSNSSRWTGRWGWTLLRAATWVVMGFVLLAAGLVWLGVLLGPPDSSPQPEGQPMTAPEPQPSHTNRLIHETSPYLLQHAHNPVDWYPWSDEAFAAAAEQDKPIFLSVGYSTCHWCHVMEHESFENLEIAAILNEHFVAIKVDREQRPDIDELYMTVTHLLTGRGGWPNSVFLTPDARPFFAGTYWPAGDRLGMPGFATVLTRVAELWENRRDAIEAQADRISDGLRRSVSITGDGSAQPPPAGVLLDRATAALREDFDAAYAGFGDAPKFPPHTALRLLLARAALRDDPEAMEMVHRTLDAMAGGGIFDHLAGGFHRYSTDESWLLPHFEKMLYDNAQLAWLYAETHRQTGRARHRRVAEQTLDWMLAELRDAGGAFHSAYDADSEGAEGKFYLWTRDEVLDVLGADDGELFCAVYGLKAEGNFRDEATRQRTGENVLHLPASIDQVAGDRGLDADALRDRLGRMRRRLREVRAERPWPMRDDKVLTAWNGLAISALARAGDALGRDDYTQAAEAAAEFLLTTMRRDGRLLRSYRQGRAELPAVLDDYAFTIDALLELHAATGDDRWLSEATALAETMVDGFADDRAGGFYFTADGAEDLLARSKSPYDRAIPAGNAVAARALAELADRTGRDDLAGHARQTLRAFAPMLQGQTRGLESMILAALAVDALGEAGASAEPDGSVLAAALAGPGEPVAPGGSFTLTLTVSIEPHWHINAAEVDGQTLIPTRVAIDASDGLTLDRPGYPQPESMQLGNTTLDVYTGEVAIRIPGRAGPDAEPGAREVVVTLSAQPCDDRGTCLAPLTRRLSAEVEIAPGR